MQNAALRLLKYLFLGSLRGLLISGAIIAVVLLTAGRVEKTGDRLQIALPMLALGCAAANGEGVEYGLRYLVMFGLAHGTKGALGDTSINQRPHGGTGGMPSAHTSTAVLGTSRLVSDCLAGNALAQSVAILGAGLVGGSRIVVGAHDLWQVLAGVVLGLGCDRLARRGSRLRRWIAKFLGRA
ncbi:phosphatase PAP2 family protein [Fuscibacter oryzae]|uniref:Phosphatase PAP2 family protein n=1 Tax=Fuscibacter oryzae TaxID=2803939 RepID=A0A8J7SV01_9RHOB|nr:phosphatase PAP2 family protein [Fuscibacter oryzae]MBL4928126.1 phosphatase PAP2 family protein [Fuscibacter oryzae]